MNESPGEDLRTQSDRRGRPTAPLDAFRLRGRRAWPRRREERQGRFFVDRFDAVTLGLLDVDNHEANPFMRHLLTWGDCAFLLGKYTLTAAGLPFVVVYNQHTVFGTRFRVGWLLHVFIGLYLILLAYQWALLHEGRAGAPRPAGSPFRIHAPSPFAAIMRHRSADPPMRARP
jgi:hypothetical protein